MNSSLLDDPLLVEEILVPTIASSEANLPYYASQGAAGADLKAHIDTPVTIEPGQARLIPTGLRMQIPDGLELQIRPRSGLALKHALTVLNTPGTIDSDYRGEIGVILINHGKNPFTVEPNMRIAQAVLARFHRAKFYPVEELNETIRGDGGFGSSGHHA